MTKTKSQAPHLGQEHTECGGIKLTPTCDGYTFNNDGQLIFNLYENKHDIRFLF